MSRGSSSSGGISAGTCLFLIFLVLKLTGTIAWSWWWVTCPLWAGLAVIGVALSCGGLIVGTVALLGVGSKRRTMRRMGIR